MQRIREAFAHRVGRRLCFALVAFVCLYALSFNLPHRHAAGTSPAHCGLCHVQTTPTAVPPSPQPLPRPVAVQFAFIPFAELAVTPVLGAPSSRAPPALPAEMLAGSRGVIIDQRGAPYAIDQPMARRQRDDWRTDHALSREPSARQCLGRCSTIGVERFPLTNSPGVYILPVSI